jgi:uncharacterized membrane protein YbhN (UPF0104 family)
MKKSPLRLIGSLLVLLIFIGAAWLLCEQLRHYSLHEILASMQAIPTSYVVAAIVLTVVNYLILVGYDVLAVKYVGQSLALWRIAMASFCGYACSYNFGATLAGTTVRYRLYSAWNVPVLKILQLLVILGLTFWFGVFALAGLVFVFAPLRIPDNAIAQICAELPANLEHPFRLLFTDSRPFGGVLLAIALFYLGTSALHRGSIKIKHWELPVPPFRLSLYQVGIASADMLVAALVLYVLFPAVKGGYLTVLAAYLVAYVLVVLSHVPGGWGVLEAVMLGLFRALNLVPDAQVPHVIAAMAIFRVIYFLAPLLIALTLLGVHELALRGVWFSGGLRD